MIRFLILFVLIAFSINVRATELPTVVVQNGMNKILLTIENNTSTPVTNLTVTVDKNHLPGWMVVQEQIISIYEGMTNNVAFPITIINPPKDSEAELPFVLTDDIGRTWQVRLGMRFSEPLPTETVLLQNVPNPFNPDTVIRYHLGHALQQRTTLAIYSLDGQLIRLLVNNESQNQGTYEVRWDGKDAGGRQVASGPYIYRLVSGNFQTFKKMMLLK
ncbi:MAG: T9SS type A sorting domain-containing protein [Candidatus Latescibacteria bacterium]|nr:T9SS type A sorting domain-containing protein [Candidatus Latescibacterota bacterium]